MNPTDQSRLTTAQAATLLALDLGLSEAIWSYRLQNWRKPGRKSLPLAHVTTEDGSPAYLASAVHKFINDELAKREIVMRLNGAPAARLLAGAVPMFDGTDHPHVRVTFAISQLSQSVFAIDARMARRLATSLIASAELVDKHAPVPSELDDEPTHEAEA